MRLPPPGGFLWANAWAEKDEGPCLGQGPSEKKLGGSEKKLGGSEKKLGGSEKKLGGSEKKLGGSEKNSAARKKNFGGSEKIPRAVNSAWPINAIRALRS